MITRVFEITDTCTREFYLVIQFEDIDKELCNKLSIAPGFKIINRITGRRVETFAGYRFNPEDSYENIENQSSKLQIDGTIQSFGLLLSGIDNIKMLPEQINLENIRLYSASIGNIFINENILEEIRNSDRDNLRKILYNSIHNHIAIVDIVKKEVLIDIGTSTEIERLIPQYLWIPVQDINAEELMRIELSPFKLSIILPVNI